MYKIAARYIAIASIIASPLALGEVVTIPVGQQSSAIADAPHRGESKSTVESRFGAPENQSRPVGSPPISQWHYPGFSVYFEGEQVIHTVAKKDATLASALASDNPSLKKPNPTP